MADEGVGDEPWAPPYNPTNSEEERYREHFEFVGTILRGNVRFAEGASHAKVLSETFLREQKELVQAFMSFAADMWEVTPTGFVQANEGREDWGHTYDMFVARLMKIIKGVKYEHVDDAEEAIAQFTQLLHVTADCVRELVDDTISGESAGNWGGYMPNRFDKHMTSVETKMGKSFIEKAETLIKKYFKWMDPRIEKINEDMHEYSALYIGAPFVDLCA